MGSVLARAGKTVALGIAWLFILTSFAGLITTIVLLTTTEGGDEIRLFRATVDGQGYNAVGLAYRGQFGVLLAASQSMFIALCLVLSLLPFTRWRRAGHLGLLAWGALFVANAAWFVVLGAAYAQAALAAYSGVWLCVLLRAITGWTPRAARKTRTDANATKMGFRTDGRGR